MKAEINNENRRKFEALYFGQNVFWSCKVPMEKDNILDARKLARPLSKYDCIELKPLSSISNEDIKNVCIIEGYIHEENSFGQIIRSKTTIDIQIIDNDYPSGIPQRVRFYLSHVFFIEWDNMQSHEDNQTQGVSPNAYDYLRSKGYVLPWMGLSVEEMIEAGWIKLVEL